MSSDGHSLSAYGIKLSAEAGDPLKFILISLIGHVKEEQSKIALFPRSALRSTMALDVSSY